MIEKRSIFSIYLIKLYKTTQKEILFRQYFFNNNVHVLNVNKSKQFTLSVLQTYSSETPESWQRGQTETD